MNNEPVTVQAAIAAAINGTLGLLNFLGIDQALVGALQLVAGLWIVVIFVVFVRSKVTPNVDVKLTVSEFERLREAGYQTGRRKLNPEGDTDAR